MSNSAPLSVSGGRARKKLTGLALRIKGGYTSSEAWGTEPWQVINIHPSMNTAP